MRISRIAKCEPSDSPVAVTLAAVALVATIFTPVVVDAANICDQLKNAGAPKAYDCCLAEQGARAAYETTSNKSKVEVCATIADAKSKCADAGFAGNVADFAGYETKLGCKNSSPSEAAKLPSKQAPKEPKAKGVSRTVSVGGPKGAKSEEARIFASLDSDTLRFRITSKRPAETVFMVMIVRNYSEKNDGSEYTHTYYSDSGTAVDFATEQNVDVRDSVWWSAHSKHQAQMERVGLAGQLDRVSDNIEIKLMLLMGDVEWEVVAPIPKPLGTQSVEAAQSAPVENLNPVELKAGQAYRASGPVPLAPSPDASVEALAELMANGKFIPTRSRFELRDVVQRGSVPWYRVSSDLLGEGWINSTALLKCQLEAVE